MKKRILLFFCLLLVISCESIKIKTNHAGSSLGSAKGPIATAKKKGASQPTITPTATKATSVAVPSMALTTAETNASELQRIEALEKNNRWLDATKEWIRLFNLNTNENQYRVRALNNIEARLTQEELTSLLDENPGVFSTHIYYKLGEMASDNNDRTSALRYFEKSYNADPESDIGKMAKSNYDEIYSLKSVSPQTIGVVLPLTGKSANVAQRALRGIQVGLGLHLPGSKLKLSVIDSEGAPEVARRGVERLVREDNPIAIIGSLLSKNATAMASKANELEVPSIALSQKAGVTEVGPYVFRNALTSEMQIQELVRIAMEEMGATRFAIMYPNDSYGVEYANIFWDMVLARGGKVVAIQTYSPKETDFRDPIQRLVGTYYVEAREAEYKALQKAKLQTKKKKSLRKEDGGIALPPIVDFDAIFIPDNVKSVGQITAMLSYNDVKNVALLGTNLLNHPDLSKRLGPWSSRVLFIDGYFLENNENRFSSIYKSIYGEEPSLVEAQAFDTAYLLRTLIASGVDTREELARKLSTVVDFPASIGKISISSDREFIRPTFALTLEKGKIVPFRFK